MRIGWMILALPLAEIAGFVIVGRWIGVLAVLGLVILAGLVGLALLRSAGGAAGRRLQAAISGRENALLASGAAAFRVVAGLLFLIPGFVTDLLALLLLLPPVQAALLARVMAQTGSRQTAHEGQVIEGEAVEITPPAEGPSGWTRH